LQDLAPELIEVIRMQLKKMDVLLPRQKVIEFGEKYWTQVIAEIIKLLEDEALPTADVRQFSRSRQY